MGRQNSSSPSRIRSRMVVWGWFRRFRRGGLYLAEKEAKEPVCVRRRRWVWFLEKSWHACWVASQLHSGSMYMGKGGVKAVVLTCSFDLSLGCHAGRDEKGGTHYSRLFFRADTHPFCTRTSLMSSSSLSPPHIPGCFILSRAPPPFASQHTHPLPFSHIVTGPSALAKGGSYDTNGRTTRPPL